MNTVRQIAKMPAVLNTSMSIDFAEVVIVSETELASKRITKNNS